MANLFDPIPPEITAEIIQVLLATGNFRLERIVSAGQATPPGSGTTRTPTSGWRS